jgi:hypothetical protein
MITYIITHDRAKEVILKYRQHVGRCMSVSSYSSRLVGECSIGYVGTYCNYIQVTS